MKKPQYYIDKITTAAQQWRDYLPITNVALFAIVVALIGVMIFLVIVPSSGFKPLKNESVKFDGAEDLILAAQNAEPPEPSKFYGIEKKNLFSPGRTDWAGEPPPTPVPPPRPQIVAPPRATPKPTPTPKPRPKFKPNRIKLSAILAFGETKVALINNLDKSKIKDKLIYVKEGDDVVGYTVKSIDKDKLVLEWNGEESIIKMYKL